MIRWHLDEHVDRAVANALRGRGIDVTTTIDAALISASDEDHVAFALREGRVIFTHDADYLRLASQGVRHAGIAYCPPNHQRIGRIIRWLTLLSDVSSNEEMVGKIEFL